MSLQDKWMWCKKCQVLSFSGTASLGKCPAGSNHDHTGSGNYALPCNEPTVPGQDNWRWCKKCQALSFAGGASMGACSGGGQHDHTGSGNYNLLQASNGAQGQHNWRWCNKCQVLSFAGSATPGACAAGGVHDHAGSGDYVMAQIMDCSPLLAPVKVLEAQIAEIQNSPGYIQDSHGPKPGKPDQEMLGEVTELNKQLTQKAKAYHACTAKAGQVLNEWKWLKGSRHFGPQPLWVLGHNTNTIQQVVDALDQGANAVEIDVTAYAHNLNALCIDHAGIMGDSPGHANAPALEPFLHELRKIADARPELALVSFDLKPPGSRPDMGPVLVNAIRSILTSNNHLNVMMSVADVTTSFPDRLIGSTVFDSIHATIGQREGYMIDADNNVDGVADFFTKTLKMSRFGYGNGTSFDLSDEGAMVYRTPIEKACWMGAALGQPGYVEAWTVNSIDNLKLYLRIGVNGLISDENGIKRVRTLLQDAEFSKKYRMAERFDDPMSPDNFAYGLTVKTSDVGSAGTDSKITFTLNGQNGSSSTMVDTNYNARMEQGQTNFVVLFSRDLGALQSITVKSEDNPGWHLDSIVVQSHRYGVKKSASFQLKIDSSSAVTRNLV